jgi:hypothetical protein
MTEKNVPSEDRPNPEPVTDLPKEMYKKTSKVWEERPYVEPTQSNDEQDYNDINDMLTAFGSDHLSREQFNELAQDPIHQAAKTVTEFQNQQWHFHNSFLGQNPTQAGMLSDVASETAYNNLKGVNLKHAIGHFSEVQHAMIINHRIYKKLLEHPAIQGNSTFLNSYSGQHLINMVHTTMPNLIKRYGEQVTEE